MEDEAVRIYYNDHPGVIFEMGCPWCKRSVSILLDIDGSFLVDEAEASRLAAREIDRLRHLTKQSSGRK